VNVILLKNDEVIDFLTSPPTDFSALKNVQACSSLKLKFQTFAEKTAKHFRGLLYFATLGRDSEFLRYGSVDSLVSCDQISCRWVEIALERGQCIRGVLPSPKKSLFHRY